MNFVPDPPPGPDAVACQQCRHYHGHADGAGECRRFPPSYSGDSTANERHRWRHPSVQPLHWCGEFQRRDA